MPQKLPEVISQSHATTLAQVDEVPQPSSQQHAISVELGDTFHPDRGNGMSLMDQSFEKGFIQLNTHDVSHVEQHVKMDTFAQLLQQGVDALWSTRDSNRYKEVHVLLLRWEDDNLGVDSEIKRLGNVFSDLYRFDVCLWNIPKESPARLTIARVSELVEACGNDSLIIMYYAGHGGLSKEANVPAIWAA